MNRPLKLLTALAVGALAASCGETHQQVPTAATPSFAQSTLGSTCSFSAMNSDIAKFFSSSTQQKLVKGLQSTMQTYWSANNVSATQNAGYDIFAQIAAAVDSGNVGTVSSGSNLVNEVTACMFFDSSQLPADFPHDYTTALTPSAEGGFAVRGGASDPSDPVLARTGVSGIAPVDPFTWTEEIDSCHTVPNPPARVLFYGEPTPITPYAYTWSVIPANATFLPGLLVGLCDPGNTYMIYSSEGSILPYQPVDFVSGICATASAPTNLWQKSLAVGKRLISQLLPSPLDAATLGLPGASAQTTGFSTFTLYDVNTVTVTFAVQPHDATVLPTGTCPTGPIGDPYDVGPVSVQVTKNGIPVGGVTIALTQINNNGTPATICGHTFGTTDDNGNLTLDGIGLTKTGAYQLVASGGVTGRNISSTGGTSNKFNIRP